MFTNKTSQMWTGALPSKGPSILWDTGEMTEWGLCHHSSSAKRNHREIYPGHGPLAHTLLTKLIEWEKKPWSCHIWDLCAYAVLKFKRLTRWFPLQGNKLRRSELCRKPWQQSQHPANNCFKHLSPFCKGANTCCLSPLVILVFCSLCFSVTIWAMLVHSTLHMQHILLPCHLAQQLFYRLFPLHCLHVALYLARRD